MAETFPLRILTPAGIVFEGEAEELYAVGGGGEFGVLAEHVNFITSLRPGFLKVITLEGTHTHFVSGGLAEVKDGAMTVLADSIEDPEKIDTTGLEEKIAEAERRVLKLSYEEPEYETAENELRLVQARKEAAESAKSTSN